MLGLDFFAGVGMLRLAMEQAGIRSEGACEIDEFCRDVYEQRFGAPPLWRDIRSIRPSFLPYADIWFGGFPCTDISQASGSHATYLDGERSGLWFAWLDLIRTVRPGIVLVENVPANIARWLPRVLGGLAECGYDAEWRVLSAAEFGAPHLRRRMAIVAHRRGLASDLASEAHPHAHRRGLADDSQPDRPEAPGGQTQHRGDAHRLVPWSPASPSVRVADGVSRRMDRARVKACGNGVFVPQWRWIGRRIVSVLGTRADSAAKGEGGE